MASTRASSVRPLIDDLHRVFGRRLLGVVVYGRHAQGPIATLALTETLTLDDLDACAERIGAWRRAGLATPLLQTRTEFARSLDAFPIEYGEILDHHELVHGSDPFHALAIDQGDLRRACEVQVKSHLLHLREDYLEAAGSPREVATLVRESAPAFAALLRQLARLDGGGADTRADLGDYVRSRLANDGRVVDDLLALAEPVGPEPVDAVRIFPAYLDLMERLAALVDRWR